MNRLNKTPFQLLLMLLGLLLLVLMGLNLWQSYNENGHDAQQSTLSSVEILSAEMLTAPPIQQFRQMMQAPLFWEARTIPIVKAPIKVPPVVNVKPSTPMSVTKPDGRLVGVVDLGDERFALVQGEEGKGSQHLRERERWQGWTVAAIETQKVVLEQAGQQHELLLISDFKAPTASQTLTTAKTQAASNTANNKNQPAAPARKSSFMPAQAAASMDPEQIKQMREARRKLLQARWGNAESPQKK